MRILSSRNEETLELTYSNKKMNEENSKAKKKANKLNSEKREPFPSTGQRTTLNPGTLNQAKEGSNSASEIVGYMPLRGDFDVEYDNDAELLLAEMEFTGKKQFYYLLKNSYIYIFKIYYHFNKMMIKRMKFR